MTNSLILFGAGASFGSGEVVPKAPPIAGRLLAALSRLYPNARGELSKESQSSLSEDFEAGMVAIGDRRPHALPPLERSMASFFFNFRPRVNNLYRELAQQMKKYSWSGALVTLNYERLLESSLLEEGLLPYSGIQPAKGRPSCGAVSSSRLLPHLLRVGTGNSCRDIVLWTACDHQRARKGH